MKLSEAKAGVMVKADGGFTCIPEGAVRTIKIDEDGFPYIYCDHGVHWLGGQVDRNGDLIGFTRVGEP